MNNKENKNKNKINLLISIQVSDLEKIKDFNT